MPHSESVKRHWADHPVGVHADRVWRSLPIAAHGEEDDYVQASNPPSDMLRTAQFFDFKPYVYGASPEHLRPMDEYGIVKPEFKPASDAKPIRVPKAKPKPVPEERNPDTFKPPMYNRDLALKIASEQESERARQRLAESKRLEQKRKENRKKLEEQWAEHEAAYELREQQRVRRLEKENEALKHELDEALGRLEQVTPKPAEPLPVQFICSGCDQTSPLFTPTHYRCMDDSCACYKAEPELHDNNRRYPLP